MFCGVLRRSTCFHGGFTVFSRLFQGSHGHGKVMENGRSWKSHGKVMENEVVMEKSWKMTGHGKKSWKMKKVMEKSHEKRLVLLY